MVIELKRVFISDEIDPRCVEVLKENGIEVVKDTKLRTDKEKFLAEISKYDGLIVRSATKVTADVINAATNLKIIGRAGTGVDNIDCDAATKRGIIVMNTPGGNTLSAAEHTCALMCCLSRDIPNAVATMRAGTWDRKSFMGSELSGKTLAIIGLGRIGKEVALRMQSFGMTTIGYDPIIPGSVSAQFDTEWMELEKIWPLADYITVHTPLIPQTRNLINEAVFAKCKKGVKVVNCARGGIIDEAALLKALDAGQCGGAGLDVYVNEPPDDYTLAKHPKVIPTPHLGASTVEAQKRVAVEIAEQFVDVMHGRSLFGAINAHAMHNALSADTQPWVDLGRSLGSILARLGVDPKKGVSITSCGAGLKDAGSYLAASVLSGLLTDEGGAGDAALNLVSAPAVAKQRGIQVESKYEVNKEAQYSQMVSVCADGRTLIGTTSGGQALLISINGAQFSTPAVLSGSAILFQAKSDPKLLATVAGSLSSNGAVVTGVSVTVDSSGSQWGLVYLPSPPPNGLFNISKTVQSAFELEF
ncbi:D-3-phosphoglycerate dehydrogenase-like [Ruditapes philippinarum]|uniref:D-3-phosphoglycerate dehydrogenase-like n=1 Tax=Ruditapes philippinarum TaxID=129788 RepID=UPI00295BA772|nr:D-3-phosphoglycerate dehydrogenase-like [Ruditapes philippinarum]